MSADPSTTNSTAPETPSTPATTPAATPAAPTSPGSLIAPAATPEPAAPLAQGEWKEYAPDPNKTADENAAAKAEHDAKKPAEAPKEEPKAIAVTDIKLPEGVTVDEPVMTEFLGLINDPKVTKAELAQKLVDLNIKSTQEAFEKASLAWETRMTDWQSEVRADPEVGGARFDQSVATANKVVQQHGDPELAQLCADTGIGNNVHFVKFLNRIAPKLLEAAPAQPGTPPAGNNPNAVAERMYPTMKK